MAPGEGNWTPLFRANIRPCLYKTVDMDMERYNIWLKKEQLEKLRTLSEKTAAPVSALIRKAIEEYLKKKH
jgi:hypothetical protein